MDKASRSGALVAARRLPPAAQDDIARVVLRLAGADDEAPVPLTPDERKRLIPAPQPPPLAATLAPTMRGARSVGQRLWSVKLRYTQPALADLTAIVDYLAAQSPQGARRVQARIQAVTDLLLS